MSKFLQTSSVLTLIGFSLFSFSAKAMESDDLTWTQRVKAGFSRLYVNWQHDGFDPEDVSQAIVNSMEEQTRELRNRIDQQNEGISNLSRKLNALEGKLNPLQATLRHSNATWVPYTASGYKPVTFNHFEGDERMRGNQNQSAISMIEIPEDGYYHLSAHYCWHADNKGSTAPYTGIAINSPDNLMNYFVHHHLASGYEDSARLTREENLKAGDHVMVSIQGAPNAEYFLGHFQFDVKKIR